MFGRPVYVIETGARSVIGLMRPRTAALPAPLRFPTRCGSAGILARPQPVNVQAPGLRDPNWYKIGSRPDGEYRIWGQTRCLCIKTKRQQAAALQTLRAYQRPLHPRQRVKYHSDQRRDRMGPYGDRHVVGLQRRRAAPWPRLVWGLAFGPRVIGPLTPPV